MLKLITLAIFSLSINSWGRAPGTYSSLRTDLQKTTSKTLLSWVNGLVSESAPSRMVGMPGHDKARDYLLGAIKSADPKNTGKTSVLNFSVDIVEGKRFYQKDFDDKVEGKIPKSNPDYYKYLTFTRYMQEMLEKLKATKADNIVWEKAGINSKKVLVVTAHYDTISHDPQNMMIRVKEAMPGANYNASGVAVALGLINTLSTMDLNYSVEVVFLDWQGIGFLGSYQHAKELKQSGKEVIGVVNLEMLGQDTSFFDKTKKNGNMSVYVRANSDEERFVKKLTLAGSQITSKVIFEIKPIGFENSDNIRYWDQGILAATFSQNWEDDFNPKFFQSTLDTPETLNHDTLYHAYQYLGGAVIGTLLDLTK